MIRNQCTVLVVILFVIPFVNEFISFYSEVIFVSSWVIIHCKKCSRSRHGFKNSMSSICFSSVNISIKNHIVTTVISKVIWYCESRDESMMSVYHHHAFGTWSRIEKTDLCNEIFVSCIESFNECFCCLQRVSSFYFMNNTSVKHIVQRLPTNTFRRCFSESVNIRISWRVQCAILRILHEFILIQNFIWLSHTWLRCSKKWHKVIKTEFCDRHERIFFSTVQLTIIKHVEFLWMNTVAVTWIGYVVNYDISTELLWIIFLIMLCVKNCNQCDKLLNKFFHSIYNSFWFKYLNQSCHGVFGRFESDVLSLENGLI